MQQSAPRLFFFFIQRALTKVVKIKRNEGGGWVLRSFGISISPTAASFRFEGLSVGSRKYNTSVLYIVDGVNNDDGGIKRARKKIYFC